MAPRTTRTVNLLTCSYCNRSLPYPDAYPSSIYAQCWKCFWDDHMKTEHRPKWWTRLRLRNPFFLVPQ